MKHSLFVISPYTKEIFPYLVNPEDSFLSIINDLKEKKKPHFLVFYTGDDSIFLNGVVENPSEDVVIEDYLPKRQSQILIYAFPTPSMIPLMIQDDRAQFDTIMFLLTPSLSEIIPIYVTDNDNVATINNFLKTRYGFDFSIVKYQGSTSLTLTDETVSEILPERVDQILLLLRSKGSLPKILNKNEKYQELATSLEEKKTLYVDSESDLQPFVANLKYGCGGSKCAYYLSPREALMLPNVDGSIHLAEAPVYWERMVKEEVNMSTLLQREQLLGPNSREATIYLEQEMINSLPCYISDSFAGLQEKGIHVFDNSTRVEDLPSKIFEEGTNVWIPRNWNCLMESLMDDIVLMYKNDLPPRGDSVHFALIREDCPPAFYKVRYFGYDFSSKRGPLEPLRKKKLPIDNRSSAVNYAMYIVHSAMGSILELVDPGFSESKLDLLAKIFVDKTLNKLMRK